MANTLADRTLTEAMLKTQYSDNGEVVDTLPRAKALLAKRGFCLQQGVYRNRVGKVAYIYPIRDAKIEGSARTPDRNIIIRNYTHEGYLVSFGGEPKSCYDLKFTKILKPQSLT